MLRQTRGLRGFHSEGPAQQRRRRVSCLRRSPHPRPSCRAKAPAHPAAQRGWPAEWGSRLSRAGAPRPLPAALPHCPLLGRYSPPLPSAHRDPREGQVLCSNLQNHHSLRAHPVTPGSGPCPTPTSPRTPASVRLGSAPLHCGRSPGARAGSLSSPAGQSPGSPSRGASSPPPTALLPRGWSSSSWRHLPAHAEAGGPPTEGTREGSGLRCGGSGKSRETSSSCWRAAAAPPSTHTLTHAHSHSRTHTHTHTHAHSRTHTGRS